VVEGVSDLLLLAPEVERALADGLPVVALETTLVTHGLPAPEGVLAARELEAAVRDQGALPATIGVLSGRARVGLTSDELDQLAAAPRVPKLSLSNLAAAIASGAPGSTTVAATLQLAHLAGIRVMATGGIGGVHRRAESSGDVSADLTALARLPVAVVCAGAKAVLDLPRTREMLETLGVPVLGFGSDRFPAFYRRDSGLAVDARFDRVPDLAAAVRAHWSLGSPSGVLVANPIPAEHELPAEVYEPALERALAEAARAGASGRDVTPFLLQRLRELTGGRSVAANRALLASNARLSGRLAVALSQPAARRA
jgi:pseudouridine-5'-phosphate glycosidase